MLFEASAFFTYSKQISTLRVSSKSSTVWVQIRPGFFSGPNLGPNGFIEGNLSADDK